MDSVMKRKRHILTTEIWIKRIWQETSRSAEEEILVKMSSFPEIFEKFDSWKALQPSERSMAELWEISSSYEAMVREVSAIRDGPSDFHKTYSYGPSRFLDSDKDTRLLDMFPRARVYNELAAALTDIVALSAHLILHLELLQLFGLAAGTWDVGASADNALFAKQGLQRAHLAVSHDCDAIIESMEQFLRPGAGIFLGAGKIPLPVAIASVFLAKSNDPRLEYILTVLARYQTESGFPLADLLSDRTGLRSSEI